jgi:flagellar export protein FliJ
MNDQEQSLHRIERLAEVRQSYVTAAEGRVRDAEHQVRSCEEIANERDRQIQQAREEIAYLDHSTGAAMQNRERYIFGLHVRARQARDVLEKARKVLDGRRVEWRETMRDQKVVEKVLERRVQEWKHSVLVAEQKDVDEMTVARYARDQIHRQSGEFITGTNGSIEERD